METFSQRLGLATVIVIVLYITAYIFSEDTKAKKIGKQPIETSELIEEALPGALTLGASFVATMLFHTWIICPCSSPVVAVAPHHVVHHHVKAADSNADE